MRKSEIKPARGISHNEMGLGPMAVLPSIQRQGIGSRLVEEGLVLTRSQSECWGNPWGFEPSLRHRQEPEDEIIMRWRRWKDRVDPRRGQGETGGIEVRV